jgi:hypothetical protein
MCDYTSSRIIKGDTMDYKTALSKANDGKLKPPMCAIEGCENKAFLLTQGQFVCGDCITRFQNYQQKIMNEILTNINEKAGGLIEDDSK